MIPITCLHKSTVSPIPIKLQSWASFAGISTPGGQVSVNAPLLAKMGGHFANVASVQVIIIIFI